MNVDAETPGRDACEPDAWTVVLVNREVSLDEALERSLQVPRANRHRKRRIHRRTELLRRVPGAHRTDGDGIGAPVQRRTINSTPATSSAAPIRREGVNSLRANPMTPKRSIASEAAI